MDTTDEKYPLLLLGNEDGSQKGGRKMEFKKKTRFGDPVRNKNILQGATTIITQWPGRWTACWATTLCAGLLIIIMSTIISFSLQDLRRHQSKLKCAQNIPARFTNKTIHIVHDGNVWNQKQLNILKYILETYQNYSVHISIFQNETNSNSRQILIETSTFYQNQKTNEDHQTIEINSTKMADISSSKTTEKLNNENSLFLYDGPLQSFDPFFLFEKLRNLKPLKRVNREVSTEKNEVSTEPNLTFENLTNNSNIFIDFYSYEKYFRHTPLQFDWMNLDPEILIFACRVQELWQYSGISFLIPKFDQPNAILNSTTNFTANDSNNTTNITQIEPKNPQNSQNLTILDTNLNEEIALKSLILTSKSVFENLNPNLVIVDRKGYHLGSKIPCHAFFGELLTKIGSNSVGQMKIQNLIVGMLQEFCKRGAVNVEDCKMI